jgi:hypothetical protein
MAHLLGCAFVLPLSFFGLFDLAVSMLFAVSHGLALQRFKNVVGKLPLQEPTIADRFFAGLLVLILRPQAGSASFLNQCDLLVVGHATDVS